MKNIFKHFLIAVLVVFGLTSCEDSDLAIDELYENVDTSGAVIRILEYPADLINVSGGNVPNVLNFTFEIQEGDGSFDPNFKEVRFYLDLYKDQDLVEPVLDQDGNVIGEKLIQTISKAEFTEMSDINGLPMYTIEIPTQTIVDDLFPEATLTPPSFIVSRFELEMTDGRIWSDENAGTTLSGPYFESPFVYKTIFLPI
jgi:hypothetical protein